MTQNYQYNNNMQPQYQQYQQPQQQQAQPGYDWNSALPDIQKANAQLVPDGRYAFQVKTAAFTYWSNGKLAGYPKCELVLNVWNESGTETEVSANLTLADSMVWIVRQFWCAVGERVMKDEPFCPPWSTIKGRMGWLDLGHRTYKDKDNNNKTVNDVKRYLEPDGRPFPPMPQQQQFQQPQQSPQPQGDGVPF